MELIASGRDADVFAIDGQRVLRRCRDRATSCEPEAATMEWVRRQGYPAPRVYSAAGPDLVMERVAGPTLAESLQAGTTTTQAVGATLAELLTRLHALEPPPGSKPGHAVRHLDLHPLNVIASPTGPVVIDWRNSDVGPAGVDSALTGVILAQIVLAPSPLVPPELAAAVAELLEVFLRSLGPPDSSDLASAVDYRSGDPTLTPAELATLAGVPELLRASRPGERQRPS